MRSCDDSRGWVGGLYLKRGRLKNGLRHVGGTNQKTKERSYYGAPLWGRNRVKGKGKSICCHGKAERTPGRGISVGQTAGGGGIRGVTSGRQKGVQNHLIAGPKLGLENWVG